MPIQWKVWPEQFVESNSAKILSISFLPFSMMTIVRLVFTQTIAIRLFRPFSSNALLKSIQDFEQTWICWRYESSSSAWSWPPAWHWIHCQAVGPRIMCLWNLCPGIGQKCLQSCRRKTRNSIQSWRKESRRMILLWSQKYTLYLLMYILVYSLLFTNVFQDSINSIFKVEAFEIKLY